MDMQHGHMYSMYGTEIQSGHEAWTCSSGWPQGHAAWIRSIDMQHGYAAWTRSTEIQNGHATGGHAAWKRSRDLLTPYSRPLLFSLLNRFGLWDRVSSVVPQRAEKARAFSVALSIFSRCSFPRSPFAPCSRARKKHGGPPLSADRSFQVA